jgi:SNF2 family DNA or RNA helicase
MTLKSECPFCGKKAEVVSETYLASLNRYTWLYKCGHTWLSSESLQSISEAADFTSLDGSKKAYEFQIEGIKFAQKTNGNCLIADAMGLGKTIQFLLWLRHNYESAIPALIVVKSATIYQWVKEFATWTDNTFPVFFIADSKQFVPPGFKAYVISHDLLAREYVKGKGVWEKLVPIGFKTLCIDECHGFKDPGSKRTGALIKFIKASPDLRHKILMSGTPIKNRASEYFTALNIIAPEHFPSQINFNRWLVGDENGSLNRIAPWMLDRFERITERFVIRREKRDVMKNLPDLQRTETYIEITDPGIRSMYNAQLDLWGNARNSGKQLGTADILGYLAKLRHITALGKAMEHGANMVREFLENTDSDTKICVGIHHKSVAEHLLRTLAEFEPITLSGVDDPRTKNEKVELSKQPQKRLMIANILAGGVGLNLQHISNAMVLERQWSAADERQFEDRFHRNGQQNKVVVDYVIAKGTIDEFFADLVRKKRAICAETIGDDSWDLTGDASMLKDLSEQVLNSRL